MQPHRFWCQNPCRLIHPPHPLWAGSASGGPPGHEAPLCFSCCCSDSLVRREDSGFILSLFALSRKTYLFSACFASWLKFNQMEWTTSLVLIFGNVHVCSSLRCQWQHCVDPVSSPYPCVPGERVTSWADQGMNSILSPASAELRPGSELLMPPGDHACSGHSGYQHPDCLQGACAPSSCHYWYTNLTPAAHLPGVCWRSGAFSVEQNGRQLWNHKLPSLPTCFPPSVWELPVHLVSITEWRMSMCFLPHPALNLWGQFILTSHTSCPCLQGFDPCFSHILAQCWHLSSHFTPWILWETSWSTNRGAWITDNKITSIQKFVHGGEMTHSEQCLNSWVSHRSWLERSHMAPIKGEAANELWGAFVLWSPL